ncbi:N-acetylmuramoyl-L-alanine amidase [Stutzerimonas tarimensis]|uniref:N-acetylmuramoyl-L-alanine amidase n=1 Tax=Stutzerimonas tarimensis TaxID=1507735 RepID=A0ABV7T625_9GAMM
MKAVALALALLLLTGCASGLRIDTSHPSVGHDSRVQFVIMHYTSADLERSLAILTGNGVSSHYLIGSSPATVYRLVEEDRRAWHAGDSEWNGRTWLNATSIGIELVNPGFVDTPEGRLWYPYSEQQIDNLIVLLRDILTRHGLEPGAVVGHSDIAPQRKVDPGPLFPWQRLAEAGLALWPDAQQVAAAQPGFAAEPPTIAWYQEQLAAFGYRVPRHGEFDEETRSVIAAFQMRFRPERFDGQPDAQTAAMLAVLNAGR